jgi:hypothetical protein
LRPTAGIVSPDDVDDYVDLVLQSDARALPIVMLGAPPGGNFPASPDRVADELAGVAHVAALSGHLAWERLVARLPRELVVPRGGARLYWPGFGSDRQLHHRFWTLSRLRELGERSFARELFGTLSRLSVRAVPRDPMVARLRRLVTEQRLAQVRDEPGADPELVELYEAEIADVSAERDGLKADIEILVSERDQARGEVRRLRTEVAAYRRGHQASDVEATLVDELADYAPDSWEDVAELADLLPTEGFQLTERALRQLHDNAYPDPGRMWWFVTQLRAAGTRYHELDGSIGRELKDWCLENFGIELSLHDGRLEAAKQDRFTHDGVTLSREPHVKVDDYKDPSRCGRIYFAVDSERRRFVVDHIGLHDLY